METITKPSTIAEVKALPNHIECKNLASALVQVRAYMKDKYQYEGKIGYSKKFVEKNNLVYLFYSYVIHVNYKVYVIF